MRWRQPVAGWVVVAALAVPGLQAEQAKAPAARPVVVFETVKGAFEITFFPADAPKSVEHILDLVKKNFYRAQRIHRVEGSLVQFGSPASRDMTRVNEWGYGTSGRPIGVFEKTKYKQIRGMVGLAHGGNPIGADSQLYILKDASPSLEGKHAIIGQVTKGMEVVDKLVVADQIRNVTLK